jgi:DASS family divalent anion:Na+ symporter
MTQGKWWRIGFAVSVAHVLVWAVVGSLWWKVLGWW